LDMQLGDIVLSKSGRDSGRMFIVCGIIDDAFVLIADGDLRKREKPKKKRLKHLEPLGKASADMIEKLAAGKRISDAEVREALKTAKEEVVCQKKM
jgi:large subunit ribosomal protein L14e